MINHTNISNDKIVEFLEGNRIKQEDVKIIFRVGPNSLEIYFHDGAKVHLGYFEKIGHDDSVYHYAAGGPGPMPRGTKHHTPRKDD